MDDDGDVSFGCAGPAAVVHGVNVVQFLILFHWMDRNEAI